jgi:hypothetical protein
LLLLLLLLLLFELILNLLLSLLPSLLSSDGKLLLTLGSGLPLMRVELLVGIIL